MQTAHAKGYQQLLAWKTKHNRAKALMVQGARRIGKSFLVEDFAKNEYKSYILVDFASVDQTVFDLFNMYGNNMRINEFFNRLSVMFSTPLYERESVIIFDEVQKCPKAREFIKYLVADGRYDYLETGSLISIKKNVQDIVIPSEEEQMQLYPLDFEEFLAALGDTVTVPFLRECLASKKPLGNVLKTVNEKLRTYMIIGGMPQAVFAYLERNKYDDAEQAKQGILNLYREDIAKYAGSYVAEARAIFDAIPAMLSHHDKKIKYSALGKGDRFSVGYGNALHWIAESMVGLLCYGVEEPTMFDGFSLQTSKAKCYMGDTGLLLTLAAGKNYLTSSLYKSFVLGKLSVNKGMMTENLIAQMLATNGHPLRFFETIVTNGGKKTKYEVDFLLKNDNDFIPAEVKSGNAKTHASLDYMTRTYATHCEKPLVLTKGDLRETDEYLFLPLAMGMLV